MGKTESIRCGGSSPLHIVLAATTAILLFSLPLWGGKTDPWRMWLAAVCGLSLGAVAAAVSSARVPRAATLLAIGLILAALTMWPSVCPGTTARTMLFWAGGVGVFLATSALAACGLSTVVMGATALAMTVVGLWSIREYCFTALILGDSSWRPFGPFVNPNALAGYALTGIPVLLALAAWLRKESAYRQPGHPLRLAFLSTSVCAAVASFSLPVSGSKGAVLAGGLALLPIVARARGGKWAAGAAIALLVVALLLPPVRNRISAAFSTQRGTTFGFRAQTWIGTYSMVRARPWTGWGPGCFPHAYPMFARVPFTAMAHSSWLQLAAEAGWPVALIVVTAFLLAFADCLRSRSHWSAVGGFATAAFFLHNLVDYTFYLPAVAFSTLAVMGAALGTQLREISSTNVAGRHTSQRWLAASGMAAGAVVSLFFAIVLLSGAQAENLVRRGLYHAAEARAARAAQTAWLDRDLWVTLGKIREGLAGEPPDQRYLQSAIEAYEYAITCARTDPAGYIGAARCYRLAGNTHSAVSLARSAALLYPNGPPALLELARCLEQAGDAQGALAVYRRIVALSDKPYGQYPALEGWADYRIAVAAAAVARSSGGKDANAMWRIAGNILSASLSWAKTYGGSLEMAGRADPRLQAELESLALDAARALAVTGQAGDAEMAENLRKLVQR